MSESGAANIFAPAFRVCNLRCDHDVTDRECREGACATRLRRCRSTAAFALRSVELQARAVREEMSVENRVSLSPFIG